jgi:tetratricopeptide (TPR) repeat protein
MRLQAIAARVILLFMTSSVLLAQKMPSRPKLPAGADTNNAHAYYQFAIDKLSKDADQAADALFWATRLEPMWADAYYARRIALLMSDSQRLQRYWSGDRRTIQSKEIRQIDSLFLRALTLDPFVSQTLERRLWEAVADEITRQYSRDGSNAAEIRYVLDGYMQRAPAATRAWMAYGEGRFDDALMLYAKAIHDDSRNGPLHAERARIFFQTGSLDSALAELNVALDDLRKRDTKDVIYVYQSKAVTEHSIAAVQQRLGHVDAAREAYGRALQEDLSYYPAHVQLAFMSLEGKDTTTALSEMDLAVQLHDDDPAAHYLYAFTLALTKRRTEAEPHLRKSIALNGDFAPPHFVLGQILEMDGKNKEALAEYRAFLAHTTRTDPRRPEAEQAAAMLATLPPSVKENHQ